MEKSSLSLRRFISMLTLSDNGYSFERWIRIAIKIHRWALNELKTTYRERSFFSRYEWVCVPFSRFAWKMYCVTIHRIQHFICWHHIARLLPLSLSLCLSLRFTLSFPHFCFSSRLNDRIECIVQSVERPCRQYFSIFIPSDVRALLEMLLLLLFLSPYLAC